MSKFLFLHSNNDPIQDIKTLDALGSVLVFRDTYLNQNYIEIFAKYDVIVLDVDNSEYRKWFASYRNSITSSQNIKCVFLHHKHTHINSELLKTLQTDWKVNSVIKELPHVWTNKDDLISKLVNNIHLPSLDTPAVESCFKSFLVEAAKKMGCGTN